MEAETATYVRPGMTTITGTQAHELGRHPDLQRPRRPHRPGRDRGQGSRRRCSRPPIWPEAAKAGEIVSLQFENVTGKAQAAGEITFGHVFKQGDLAPANIWSP